MTSALSLLATLVDFAGSLVVVAAALACLRRVPAALADPYRLDALRLRLAEGLILSLSFKTGAGLIRTITVGSWRGFAGLLLVIALRFFLGRALKAETVRHRSV